MSSTETNTSSSDDFSINSGNESERILKKISKKRRFYYKQTLKRSKRQGMCLLSCDDSHSSDSSVVDSESSGNETVDKTLVSPSENIIELTDDDVLEKYMMNYPN